MAQHLIGARVENYKRLEIVEVEFPAGGGAFGIMGRNAAGKSSLIDALESTIAGRKGPKPVEPVRDGEDMARVVATFDDLVVTRVYKPGKSPSLRVTNREGLVHSSAEKLLEALYSHVSLDPLAFARLSDADQVATLLPLIGFDPAPLDAAHDTAYAKRRDVNRDVRDLEARLDAQPKARTDLPADLISLAELSDDLADALRSRSIADELARDEINAATLVQVTRSRIEELEAALESAREHLKKREDEHEAAAAAAKAFVPSDPDPIRAQIAAADETNAAIVGQRERRRIEADLATKRAEAESLTGQLEKAKTDKRAALEAADMPVPGLTIEDGRLELDGIPFSQASTGVKIRTGTAIAMRLNPDLRMIVIRDASLLDAENRAAIDEIAKANGFLVLMELADTSGEVGVVLEEGTVAEVRS